MAPAREEPGPRPAAGAISLTTLKDAFVERFGCNCAVAARAPGRVNLIGEHTDYNDGFVLPMAIEHCTWVAAAPRDDGHVHAVSLDVRSEGLWPVDDWNAGRCAPWTSYVAGVVSLLRQRGADLAGCDLLVRSDVPVGGGLSSSAALEVAAAQALAAIGGLVLEPTELADLCRAAEHQFAGVPCGIMDQYVSVLARADSALLLDCRARTWEHIPLDLNDHVVLVVDSGVRHRLAAGEYAARQRQCRQAVEYFQRVDPRVRALRDVGADVLQVHAPRMEPVAAARARHVVSENDRTLEAAGALRHGDLALLGRLMSASHRSLRDDYQVSCRELDLLVETIEMIPGVLGARMTGAGFGGCVVTIVRREAIPLVEAAVREKYDGAGFGPARIILTRAGRGASIEFGGSG